MDQVQLDRTLRFLRQYQNTLIASYSAIGANGVTRPMTIDECDPVDVVAIKDLATLTALIEEISQ